MNRIWIFAGMLLILFSCQQANETPATLPTGIWRGIIRIQGKDLPFNFEVVEDSAGGYDAYLINADERLLLDEVLVSHDSVDIALHIFDANFKAKIVGDRLQGLFIKNYEKDYKLPFRAAYGQAFRFEKGNDMGDVADFTGTYEVTFLSDTTKAIGIFQQKGDSVTGTFLTETGDHRYLQGNVIDSTMQLSTFDGNHTYLFSAEKQRDGKLRGEFFSGKTFHDQWIGEKNENAKLANPESLTQLKDGFEKIEFSFPDVNGNKISLNDEKYKNKVIILQLSGTWCPNCMDETKFLSPWYDQNKHRGVEIIGLAYERKADFDYASTRVKKMISKLNIKYDFVIAGTNSKADAAKTLPQLNTIVAFPTTIFVGRDGKVKKIHTGFSGPGTGKYYEQFKEHFNVLVNELLAENI
jgi:thiol-disulfide isomerase/thioredoxin